MAIVGPTDYTADFGSFGNRREDPGMFKAYMPEFLYKPPYGYPRKDNIVLMRELAKTPFVHMIIQSIVKRIATTDWDIKVKEEFADDGNDYEEQIKEVKSFFDNPNGNNESFSQVLKAYVTDILEVDSGVLVKVFNQKGELVQLFARDGGSFLKNPDPFGYMGDREDIIPPLENSMLQYASPDKDNQYIVNQNTVNQSKFEKLRKFYDETLRPKAAFFQYGWTAGAMPIPFGKREIVYTMMNPRSNSPYGRSPVDVLSDIIYVLYYGATYNLDMFINNNMPEGVIQLIGAQKDQIDSFRKRFDSQFKQKDIFDNNRKGFFTFPITNAETKFTPFNLPSKEMQILEQQSFYIKLAAACFGVTVSELGFTEDSNRAVDINQSAVNLRGAITPLLSEIEYQINSQLIPEFGYPELEFCFDDYNLVEDKQKHDLLDQEIRMGVKTAEMAAKELGIDVDELKEGKEEARQQRMEEEASRPSIGIAREQSPQERQQEAALREAEDKSVRQEVPEEELVRALDRFLEEQTEEAITLVEQLPHDQLSKVKAFPQEIIKKIAELFAITGLSTIVINTIGKSFDEGVQEVEKSFNRNFVPDQQTMRAVQEMTLDNIKAMAEEHKEKIRGIIQRGVMNGDGAQKISKEIKDTLKLSKARSDAIARTESVRAYNKGSIEAARDTGLELIKTWDAKLDNRTSPICNALDGESVGINEKFKYKGEEYDAPPSHVNCRSRLRYEEKKK